ncbi:MAG: UDP-glucose 4-epimerase GalE [Flavobacteriaceae bacterium]|jgi:UDP-glucose 4-epimerase|nr:UDP-glucose 4-epimerase GalE [Candidatus Arcticimaribacter sp.]
MKTDSELVLVTGGLGYIGSHTSVLLLEKGHEVLIVDDLSNSSPEVLDAIAKITGKTPFFEAVDLKNQVGVTQLFDDYPNIKGILHFAASKAVGESVQKPIEYYQNNINSLLNVMAAIKTKTNLVFSSSCTVYGQADQLPIAEDCPTKRPESPYGNTKKIGEELLEDATKVHSNLNVMSLRYFNPVGAHPSALIGENPKDIPQNLVPYITQSALGKITPLTVYGNDYPTPDGTCIRDYIHVMDLANAHILALEYLEQNKSTAHLEIVNLGTGTGHSVMEVIESFKRVSKQDFQYSIGPKREGDITAAYASIEKAKNLLKWEPQHTLDDALASAWKWEQKNHKDNQN